MNPNFMNNISPEQMKNMMNPEMMKNASNMIAGMSDSQIQMYLSSMGMSGIDPSMFRSMCKNMSNMSDSQLNSMKDMAQAKYQNMNNNNYNNYNNSNNNNYNNNSNSNNESTGKIVQEVTKIKEDGNNLFRDKKYEEAIKKYYEAIEEIKTGIDKDKYKNELDNIERSCRLNIAACKLKTEDYDGVINECSIVLETNKCFKAYYRMGLALMNKKKYDKAYRYLDNANAMGNSSEKASVEPYLKDCKQKLDEIKKKEREERLKKEKEKEKEQEEKNKEKEKEQQKEEKNNNKNNIEEKKEEIKEEVKKEDNKLNNLQNMIEKEKEKNKINKKDKDDKDKEEEKKEEEEDDIKVEDTKDIKKNTINTSTSNTSSNYNNTFNNNNNYNNFNNFNNNQPPHLNQEYINQARNQLNNMSDEQMNMMLTQMKNMDNQTLKNMMASQGMNLTDQQIEMMKMSLTPETFKMMRDSNFNPPNMGNAYNNNINNNNISNNINTNNNINQTGNNNSMPQMPNLANMDFQQMMDFIKKNPELLKMVSPQLSQMLGGKNIDPEIMMKSMEKIMWIFSIPGRIKRFMLSWRGVCFIIFIIAIFYGLFKRK